jgi:hypothetical protein
MKRHFHFYSLLLLLNLVPAISTEAQSWEFIKEKNGIKIYTRKEVGNSIKSYMGVADIKAPADKVFAMIEDVNHTEWWDKNVTGIRVLKYEKNKLAKYYMVYDLPWPVTDRDLCVEVKVTLDLVTGVGVIAGGPLPGVVPEGTEMIRIKDYRQTWTVSPAGKDITHVVLEGHVDPAGSIPDWLANMLIVDSPLGVIGGVKDRFEKK